MKRRLKSLAKWTALLLTVIGVVLAFGGWIYVENVRSDLPQVTNLKELRPHYGTGIRSQQGVHLGGEPAVEPVAVEDLPPALIATFLAAEDEDFFTHGGYNLRSITRAFFDNYRAGRTVQGASTITQQVAKHFLASDRTWERKLHELLLAKQIEDAFSKWEILEAYLGGVYFGEQAYGITQASHTYYGVAPHDLSTTQIATLAGLLPAPSIFNPVNNQALALRERNRVLRRMHDVGILTEAQVQELRARPIDPPSPTPRPAAVIPEAVGSVQRLWDDLSPERPWEASDLEVITTHDPGFQALARQSLRQGVEAFDRRRGWRGPLGLAADVDALDAAIDGLDQPATDQITLGRIMSIDEEGLHLRVSGGNAHIAADSLDWVHGIHPRTGRSRQPRAHWREPFDVDQVVYLRRLGEGWELWQWPSHEGALLVADHHSGEVLASVGSYEVGLSSFNRAEQACRQPGSLFKTVLFAEAFSRTITAATLLSDVPTDVDSRGGVWQPRNADRDFRGYLTALDAFAASRNIPAANLITHLGPGPVVERAREMGVRSLLDPTPSLALGASCVRPSEMLDVHSTIAIGGARFGHHSVAQTRDLSTGRLRDRGSFTQRDPDPVARVVRAAAPPLRRVQALTPEVNQIMHRALRDVVVRGTAHEIPNQWPVSGKTGTSDQYDTWFTAFDPSISAVIWIGSDQNTDPFESGEHSGTVAVPTFKKFYEGLQPQIDQWPPPPAAAVAIDEIPIDPTTGLRARPGQGGVDYPFVPGTAPEPFAPTRATRQLERLDSLLY